MKSKLLMAIFAATLMTSFSAAAQDDLQDQVVQQILVMKQKLQKAQAAKGPEQKTLMGEHMKMMKEVMDKMNAMKPKAGMTMKEHEKWTSEHQKLMTQVMDQMMDEHHMMIQACSPSAK